MKNGDARLSRLEQSMTTMVPLVDHRATRAYLTMSTENRERLEGYERRYEEAGRQFEDFSEDELHDFETLVIPLAHEERADATCQ